MPDLLKGQRVTRTLEELRARAPLRGGIAVNEPILLPPEQVTSEVTQTRVAPLISALADFARSLQVGPAATKQMRMQQEQQFERPFEQAREESQRRSLLAQQEFQNLLTLQREERADRQQKRLEEAQRFDITVDSKGQITVVDKEKLRKGEFRDAIVQMGIRGLGLDEFETEVDKLKQFGITLSGEEKGRLFTGYRDAVDARDVTPFRTALDAILTRRAITQGAEAKRLDPMEKMDAAEMIERGQAKLTDFPQAERAGILQIIKGKGGVILNDKQREAMQKALQSAQVVNEIEQLSAAVNTAEGGMAPLIGAARRAAVAAGFDKDATKLNALKVVLAQLARSVSTEVGRLTDDDIRRVEAAVPTVFDSREKAQAKLSVLRRFAGLSVQLIKLGAGRKLSEFGDIDKALNEWRKEADTAAVEEKRSLAQPGFSVGDEVEFKGKRHRVVGVKPNGELELEPLP